MGGFEGGREDGKEGRREVRKENKCVERGYVQVTLGRGCTTRPANRLNMAL